MSVSPNLAFVLVFLQLAGTIADEGAEFSYNGLNGPDSWSKNFGTCSGKFQSPIDIEEHKVKRVSLPPMRFHSFATKPQASTITNNGHTVMLELKTPEPLAVSGGPLHGHYVFKQLHFHWGHNDSVGSEDTINNQSFPMELHMVFYNEKYDSFNNALKHKDGLVVLAFFYEVSDEANFAYAEIVEHLPTVVLPHSEARLARQLPMELLLPPEKAQYYTYDGSLTTPPCSEVVTWIDFKDSIPLAHDQIDEFRRLKNTDGDLMDHNNRPVQPIGERTVFFNEKELYRDSSATRTASYLAPLLICVIMLFLQ